MAEQAQVFRFRELGNLELLTAAYTRQTFAPHFHEGHVIGTIEKGALGFRYRGEDLVAAQGQINLADPGEVHNGFAVSSQGWQYRMFYFAPGQLAGVLGDICDRPAAMPYFKKGVLQDPVLAKHLLALHRDMTDPSIPLLEKESRFFGLVLGMVSRHIRPCPAPRALGKEPRGVALAKAYIQAHFSDPVRLPDLARASGLSQYYLLRVFKAATGLTPHAYLSQVRAAKARVLLTRELGLADTALACGFFDQSHMNRIFKKVFGITPGQYLGATVTKERFV